MANDGSVDVADEVGGKNKAAIHGHDNIEAAAPARSGNLLTESRDTRGDSSGGKPRAIARAHAMGPPAITVSDCILSSSSARVPGCR